MRQIVNILGLSVPIVGGVGAGFVLGGRRRKTHRVDALGLLERANARALAGGDWIKRMACCELCRREFQITDFAIHWCQRPDCMQRAANLRGFPVRVVPLGSVRHVANTGKRAP